MSVFRAIAPEVQEAQLSHAAPADFRAPSQLLNLIRANRLPDIDPWFWLVAYDGKVQAWTDILRRQYPDRVLVPFAKHGTTDDVFCFDGQRHDEEAPVYIVHTFTDPGFERRGTWDSFEVFLEAAADAHDEWLADGGD